MNLIVHHNLFCVGVYSILIYPWFNNITTKILYNTVDEKVKCIKQKKKRNKNVQYRTGNSREKKKTRRNKEKKRIESVGSLLLHYLEIHTQFSLTPPSSRPPFPYIIRPMRIYIPQNLMPEQPGPEFRTPPGETFPSWGWHHLHLCVSLLLFRSIM